MQRFWFHQVGQFLPIQFLRHLLVFLELQENNLQAGISKRLSNQPLYGHRTEQRFHESLALWGFFAMKAGWTHAAVKYDYQVSAEFARQSLAEGLCRCLMQESWWEILHRWPHAHQSVGVQSHLHAPSPDDWTWSVSCNLQLDTHAPEIAQNKSTVYIWSLLSGKHSGVAISGYQYMWDSVANQSFASNLRIFCLHPTFYPSELAFGEWRDGSWWFLIVPDHPDAKRDCKGWIWITWRKGDSWYK